MTNRTSQFLFAAVLLLCATFAHSQVAPFQGLGNVQFFDNNGKPLTSGVLYSYQAGTSTQQGTYTDSTGTILNPNPIPFGSGARVGVWLTSGAFYKFVLCLQNDGAFCAPADVLFSVDQVPGSAGGGTSSGSPFIGTFISGSANPASSGILELASGDTVCYRNTAGSANLCWRKDTNDLLSWDGGSLKFPEVVCPSTVASFDILCADNTAHRWKMLNNGGGAAQIVASGVDINTSDQVTKFHFGSTATPLGTAPTTGQYLQWNGTNITGQIPEVTWTAFMRTMAASAVAPINQTILTQAHTLIRLGAAMLQSPIGCSTQATIAVFDSTSSSTVATMTLGSGLIVDDSGALSASMTAGHTFQLKFTQANGCGIFPSDINFTAVYQ